MQPTLPAALRSVLAVACLAGASALAWSQAAPSGPPPADLTQVEQALKGNPGDAALRFRRAVLLADAGRSAEAMATLRALSEQFPDLVEPLNNQAVLLVQAGDIEAARPLLEQALRLDPNHALVRQNLGELYLLLARRLWEGVAQNAREPAFLQRLSQLRSLLDERR